MKFVAAAVAVVLFAAPVGAAETPTGITFLSKSNWKVVELIVKLLFFLAFWCVSTEVIEKDVWKRFLNRAAWAVAILSGLFVCGLMLRAASWDHPPEEKEPDPTERPTVMPTVPPPLPKNDPLYQMRETERFMIQTEIERMRIEAASKKMHKENPAVTVARDLSKGVREVTPALGNVAHAIILGLVMGGAALGIVRVVLSGCSNHLWPTQRLVLGAIAFAIAGVLDLMVWAFKPD